MTDLWRHNPRWREEIKTSPFWAFAITPIVIVLVILGAKIFS